MSDRISAFVTAVDADDELRAQVKAAASPADVVALAATRGIELAEVDLATAPIDGADISDEDLDAASGGTLGFSQFACFGSAGCHW